MELGKLYRDLSMGVLRNIAYGNEGNGNISINYRPAVCMYINEGLNRLHTAILLRENDLLLEMYEDITNYHFVKRFAQFAGNDVDEDNRETRRYILDLPEEKFKEDVAKVLRVFTQDGCELPLNNEFEHTSVFTPQAQILQVPNPVQGKVLSVKYQSLHPEVLFDDDDAHVYLPVHLLDALKAFVGYKAYSDMNQETSRARAQELLSMYQAIVDQALLNGLVNYNAGAAATYTPFGLRGFV